MYRIYEARTLVNEFIYKSLVALQRRDKKTARIYKQKAEEIRSEIRQKYDIIL